MSDYRPDTPPSEVPPRESEPLLLSNTLSNAVPKVIVPPRNLFWAFHSLPVVRPAYQRVAYIFATLALATSIAQHIIAAHDHDLGFYAARLAFWALWLTCFGFIICRTCATRRFHGAVIFGIGYCIIAFIAGTVLVSFFLPTI